MTFARADKPCFRHGPTGADPAPLIVSGPWGPPDVGPSIMASTDPPVKPTTRHPHLFPVGKLSAPADVRFPPPQGRFGVPAPGGVPEWSNGPVLKTGVAFGSPWVRIPPPPLQRARSPCPQLRFTINPVVAHEVGVGFEPTGFAKQSAPWVRRPEGAPRRRVRERVLGGKAAKQPRVAEVSVERSETQSHRAFSFGFGF